MKKYININLKVPCKYVEFKENNFRLISLEDFILRCLDCFISDYERVNK